MIKQLKKQLATSKDKIKQLCKLNQLQQKDCNTVLAHKLKENEKPKAHAKKKVAFIVRDSDKQVKML